MNNRPNDMNGKQIWNGKYASLFPLLFLLLLLGGHKKNTMRILITILVMYGSTHVTIRLYLMNGVREFDCILLSPVVVLCVCHIMLDVPSSICIVTNGLVVFI